MFSGCRPTEQKSCRRDFCANSNRHVCNAVCTYHRCSALHVFLGLTLQMRAVAMVRFGGAVHLAIISETLVYRNPCRREFRANPSGRRCSKLCIFRRLTLQMHAAAIVRYDHRIPNSKPAVSVPSSHRIHVVDKLTIRRRVSRKCLINVTYTVRGDVHDSTQTTLIHTVGGWQLLAFTHAIRALSVRTTRVIIVIMLVGGGQCVCVCEQVRIGCALPVNFGGWCT